MPTPPRRRRSRSKATPRRRSARSSTRWRCATSRSSTPRSASSRIAPTPTRCRRSPTQYPDDLDTATLYADALFLLEPRRGTRDLNDPERAAAAPGARERPREGHPAPRRLPPLRPRHRVDGGARHGRGLRRVPRQRRFPAPATSTTCRRTPGTRSGRWGDSVRANLEAWHSDLKAAIGEGLRDLSRAQPAHAALRRVERRTGRHRDAGRQGLREAHRRLVLSGAHADPVRPLRRGARGHQAARARRPGGLWDFAQGYAHLRQGEADFAARLSRRACKKAAETSKATFRIHTAKNLLGDRRRRSSRARSSAAPAISPAAIAAFERAVATRGRARLRRARAAAVCRAALAGRGAARSQALSPTPNASIARSLKDHPHNGWSLLGLQQALEGRASVDRRRRRPRRRAGRGPTPGSDRRASDAHWQFVRLKR